MRQTPSRRSMAALSCVVTCLVVSLGVVLTPGAQPLRHARLTGAPFSVPREEATQAAARAPVPQEVARQVVLKPAPKAEKKPRKKHPKPAPPPPSAEFVISSFNVLGSSHTRGGGKRGRMASGVVRIRRAAGLLSHHGVDVVGFQEMQTDQYREFLRVAGGAFDVYPGTSAGRSGVDNSLAWRTSEWTLEQAATIQIPYFDGRPRPMPYVLLRHNATGRKAWFANFHNPATNSKRGNNDGHRARAASLEAGLAVRLRAETGYPVFITGDMNERERVFCQMTGTASMVAANGGSNDGACHPPGYPMPVDWIFGSDMVTFSNYSIDDSRFVNSTSDHPMILSRALLDERDGLPPS